MDEYDTTKFTLPEKIFVVASKKRYIPLCWIDDDELSRKLLANIFFTARMLNLVLLNLWYCCHCNSKLPYIILPTIQFFQKKKHVSIEKGSL